MNCAILCNGPSREDFLHTDKTYDYIVGCNIPWTTVDATVIIDEKVCELWAKTPDLIKCKSYFSTNAWRYTDEIKKREFFKEKMISIFESLKERDSSGHAAARLMIKEGYTDIDIWGADSWFEQTIVSSTHELIPNLNEDNDKKFVDYWRELWYNIIRNNPEVAINFRRDLYV